MIEINSNVLYNILKIIGHDDDFDYKLQITVDSESAVSLCMLYFVKNEFTIFTKLIVSRDDFESINYTGTFIISKEHIQKLILLCKWYSKLIIQFEINYNIVNITLVEDKVIRPYYKIMTMFDSELSVSEPILLKNNFVVSTDSLKKAFELCLYIDQCVSVIISSEFLEFNNELLDTTIKINCVTKKKTKINKFKLRHENIKFILLKLSNIKSTECNLYIDSSIPFVIEDPESNFYLFITYD
jgi:hypothetical protein